jgi:hypothetical protein
MFNQKEKAMAMTRDEHYVCTGCGDDRPCKVVYTTIKPSNGRPTACIAPYEAARGVTAEWKYQPPAVRLAKVDGLYLEVTKDVTEVFGPFNVARDRDLFLAGFLQRHDAGDFEIYAMEIIDGCESGREALVNLHVHQERYYCGEEA